LPLTSTRTPRLAFILLLTSVLLCCNRSSPVLTGSAPSPSALAQSVLSALAQGDTAALHTLALSEEEFKEHVWPELPASRPERNLPFSYVWGDLRQKSEAALARTLAAQAGQRYELVGIRFLGDTTQYKTYVVHRRAELTVKDGAGAQTALRVFGSVLEKDGRFKVFSYILD
jgi:hypothetical protein